MIQTEPSKLTLHKYGYAPLSVLYFLIYYFALNAQSRTRILMACIANLIIAQTLLIAGFSNLADDPILGGVLCSLGLVFFVFFLRALLACTRRSSPYSIFALRLHLLTCLAYLIQYAHCIWFDQLNTPITGVTIVMTVILGFTYKNTIMVILGEEVISDWGYNPQAPHPEKRFPEHIYAMYWNHANISLSMIGRTGDSMSYDMPQMAQIADEMVRDRERDRETSRSRSIIPGPDKPCFRHRSSSPIWELKESHGAGYISNTESMKPANKTTQDFTKFPSTSFGCIE